MLATVNPGSAATGAGAAVGGSRKGGSRPTRDDLPPLVVVLDMDECLVHTQRFVDNPVSNGRSNLQASANYRQQEARPDLSLELLNKCHTLKVPIEDGGTACVNIRPGLQRFLEALAVDPNIEVHVFTAALPLYARPVLNAIDPKVRAPIW
jgi:hypothetical protein